MPFSIEIMHSSEMVDADFFHISFLFSLLHGLKMNEKAQLNTHSANAHSKIIQIEPNDCCVIYTSGSFCFVSFVGVHHSTNVQCRGCARR